MDIGHVNMKKSHGVKGRYNRRKKCPGWGTTEAEYLKTLNNQNESNGPIGNQNDKSGYQLRNRQTIEDSFNSKPENNIYLFSSSRTFLIPLSSSSLSSSSNFNENDDHLNLETWAPPKIKIEEMVLNAINYRRNHPTPCQRIKRAPASFVFIKRFISENYGEDKKANKTKALGRVILQMVSKGTIVRKHGKGMSGSFALPPPVKKPKSLNTNLNKIKKIKSTHTNQERLNQKQNCAPPIKKSKPKPSLATKLNNIKKMMSTSTEDERRQKEPNCNENVTTIKITTTENVEKELSIESIVTDAFLAFEKFNIKNKKEYPMPHVAIVNYFKNVYKIDPENLKTIDPFIKKCLEIFVERGTIIRVGVGREIYKLSYLHPQSQMADRIKTALSSFDPLLTPNSYVPWLQNYSGMTLLNILKYLETEYKMKPSGLLMRNVKRCLTAYTEEGIVIQNREMDGVWTFSLRDPLDPVLPNMVNVKVEEPEVLPTMDSDSIEDIEIDIKYEEFGTTDGYNS